MFNNTKDESVAVLTIIRSTGRPGVVGDQSVKKLRHDRLVSHISGDFVTSRVADHLRDVGVRMIVVEIVLPCREWRCPRKVVEVPGSLQVVGIPSSGLTAQTPDN